MTSRNISAAMILAAGRGERMRPLSLVVPKPALPLPGAPVIASALDLAVETGARQIVVNAWHLKERMASAVEALARDNVVLSMEEQLMGTAGGLALARDRGLLGDRGSVLVINGDGDFDLDLEALLERHGRGDDRATLALLPHPDPRRWSQVVLDPSGRVSEIVAAGAAPAHGAPFLYPGVMVVSRSALDSLPAVPGAVPNRLWWPALEEGKLGGAVVSGTWHEVGTPADYLESAIRHLGGTSRVHPSASVDSSAEVTNSFIGRNATIESGAEIFESVVAEGVTVGPGARVKRSAILGQINLSPNSNTVARFLAQQLKSQP